MKDPSTTPTIPRTIAGRYTLEHQMGSGGAGVVWRAHDRLLDRTVAVKLLHADAASDPSNAARFRMEASIAAKLTHPHAVIVYDIGQAEDQDYLVMEFVEGATLADALVAGPLAPGVAASLGVQVGRALGASHRRRLVHRDVKPANVLVTWDGVAKMADFGIAQVLGTVGPGLTQPGKVMGTARYLAPEQLRGEPVDARADVYALGVLLHEALTGDIPFGEGTAAEVASRRLVTSLPPVSDRCAGVPLSLDVAISRATRRDPDDRFADGAQFARELMSSAAPDAGPALAARVAQVTRRAVSHEGDQDVGHEVGPSGTEPRWDRDGARPEPRAGSGPIDTPTEKMVAQVAPREPAPPAAPPAAGSADRSRSPGPGDTRHAHAPTGRRRRGGFVPVLALASIVGAGVSFAWFDRSTPEAPGAHRVAEDPLAGGSADIEQADGSDADVSDAPVSEGTPVLLDVIDARDHDPFGSGEEHRADVPNAFDGDPGTTWQTQSYRGSAQLGGLKPGVGLWMDLGEPQQVVDVEVALEVAGASFVLYAGEAPPTPDQDPDRWGTRIAEVDDAREATRITLDEPADGRVWLLWFTSLPREGSEFRATVSDVRLRSS